MKRQYSIVRCAIVVALLFCVACSSAPIKFNEVTAKPVDYSKGREISSKACGFQLLLLIPISVNGRQQRAYTQLLAAAGGDYISDMNVEDSWFYGFVGTGYCTALKAKAYPYIKP